MAETAKLLNPGKDRADPRSRGRLFAGRLPSPPQDVRLMRQRYPGVPVVTYVNTSTAVKAESDICCTSGNALQGRRVARRRARDHAAGRISRAEHRRADEREDHRLEGPLRGARAVYGLRRPATPRKSPRRDHPRASGVPARGGGGSRFLRIDRGDVGLCRQAAAAPRGAADGVLDERQRRGAPPRCGVHPALQSLPAHEADHAEKHPPCAGDRPARGDDRSGHRRARGVRSKGCWRYEHGDFNADNRPVIIGGGAPD